MMKGEQIAEMHSWYRHLILELTSVGENLSNRNIIGTALNALPKTQYWSSMVNNYLITRDLNVSSLDSLFSELEFYASRDPNSKKEQAIKHRSIALIVDQSRQSSFSNSDYLTIEEDNDRNTCAVR